MCGLSLNKCVIFIGDYVYDQTICVHLNWPIFITYCGFFFFFSGLCIFCKVGPKEYSEGVGEDLCKFVIGSC